MHELLLKETGGLNGIRDENLLDSAVHSPFQTFGGEPLYPSLEAKAAHLGFALVNNHAFVDGNKRIGLLAMLTFLELNGTVMQYDDDELIALGLDLATGTLNEKSL